MNLKKALPIAFMAMFSVVCSVAGSGDEIIIKRYGCNISLSDSGKMVIIFDFGSTEKKRLHIVKGQDLETIFRLLKTDEFSNLNSEYISPNRVIAAGHEARELISYKVSGKLKKSILLGSSRTDVPKVLKEISDRVNKIAQETGPLPRHLID